jgi:hypothetical protein
VPTGGFEGQILAKGTNGDYDTLWIDNTTDTIEILAANKTGVTITRGTVVMAIGVSGDRIEIAPAVADGTVDARFILGVAAQDILDDAEGLVKFTGYVTFDTTAYTVGDILYIDPSTPGGYTTTEPTAPNLDLSVAIVIRIGNSSAGLIFVRMWSQGQSLGQLFDVNVTGAIDGNALVYDGTNGIWIPGAGGAGATGPSGVIVSSTEPTETDVVWLDLDATGPLVPNGGVTGQYLGKASTADYNVSWQNIPDTGLNAFLLGGM